MLTNKGEKRDPKTNEAIRTYVRREAMDATIALLKKNAQIEKAEETKK